MAVQTKYASKGSKDHKVATSYTSLHLFIKIPLLENWMYLFADSSIMTSA